MVILPYLDLLDICCNFDKYPEKQKIFNILYNSSSEICLTTKYIELLENEISNKDFLRSLIIELNDTNRIKIEKTPPKESLTDEFTEISLKAKIPLLIPVKYIDSNNNIQKIPFLTVVTNASPINRDWIILELLSNNTCNVSYQNFKKESEIGVFLENLFSIPKYITCVSIFNRDQNATLLAPIKGRHIEYYTLLDSGSRNEYIRKQIKKDLQKTLGGKLKLFYTSDRTILHERKIIFENILITIDNAHINLTIAEPTWEIFITYNKNKSEGWKAKCNRFKEIND